MTSSDSSSSGDAGGAERTPRQPNLWHLPEIVEIEPRLVRYEIPRVQYVGRERIERGEAVEVLIRTNGGIPQRALGPVLSIGGVELDEYDTVGPREYVFYAYEPERLEADAAVWLHWPHRASERGRERLRYRPPRELSS